MAPKTAQANVNTNTPAQAQTQAPVDAPTDALNGLEAITAMIDGQRLLVQPKRFSSGKLGWYAGGKITLASGETVQVSLNCVIPHSENR